MTSDTSLTLVRTIKAPLQAVFDAFTKPEKIALWWGPDDGPVFLSEVDAREGGRFRIRFRMEDGSEHGSSGAFAVFDPPHRLAMTWKWEDESQAASLVEVSLRPVDDGTELTFTHSRLPDTRARDSHCDGWNRAIDKLERRADELST
jgi:uncharacterized protein YndB with AHSA1/START domain